MARAPPLKVAGVPEAFNDCWAQADFLGRGLEAVPEFVSHPGGSGSMLKAVMAEEVDAAFALTDCIVAAIENGSEVRLAGPVVESPLTWAVIASGKATTSNIDELSEATWGISRFGSGSHVMVQTMAKQRGWRVAPKFVVCQNFEGLRNGVNNGTVDAFLWEHFTTRPFEESGEVKIVGGVPTPWGCFSVVVRADSQRGHEVQKLREAFVTAGKAFLQDAGSVARVSSKYGMSDIDARRWISGVRYAEVGKKFIVKEELELTRSVLRDAGVIKEFTLSGEVESYHIQL